VLAVAGGKGGSGKTTATVGLARALPGRPIAVDADWGMPNLHAVAGVPREPTLADALADGEPPDAAASERPGVRLLPAPVPDAGRGAGEGQIPDRTRTRDGRCDRDPVAALRRLRRRADAPVLVDCPAGPAAAAAPLRVADAAVVTVAPSRAGVVAAAKTVALAERLSTPVVGALAVRAGAAPDGLAAVLGCPVLAAVPTVEPPVPDREPAAAAFRAAADTLAPRLAGPG